MFIPFATVRRRLALALMVGMSLSGAAIAEEPGHVLTYKLPGGFKVEVRKMRTLQRVEGFYIGRSFSGANERFDAFQVGGTVDLGALEPANLRHAHEIAEAKATEQRTAAVIKQHPLLAPQVAPGLARLRAEIARAESGEKKIDGQWLTAEQVAERFAREQSTVKRGVLNLRNGTSYRDVEVVSINKEELRIMHADGAARIPMHLVPEEFQREHLKAAQSPKAQ